MKRNIFAKLGVLVAVASPIAAVVSCGGNEDEKLENAKSDISLMSSNLSTATLTRLINTYKQKEEKVFQDLKNAYDTNEIIAGKSVNKISGSINSTVSDVKFEDGKISFKIQTEYTQEGVTYRITHEAIEQRMVVVKNGDTYVPSIKIKTTQRNSRTEFVEDVTNMKVRENYVSIREVFGVWDDNLSGIGSDQDKGIVRDIQLVHTNDTHGRFATDGYKYNKYIGMSGIASYVKKFRPDLFLSGGDIMQGTGISNYDHGKTAMRLASLMGYDAIAAGNHEYDWDYKTLIGRAKSTNVFSDNSFGNKNKTTKAYNPKKGQLDSSYDVEAKTDEHIIPGVRTKIVKGNVPVGIISLTTPDVATKVNPANVDDVKVELLSRYAQKEINNLKAAGIKLIVIVGHMGNEAASVETTEQLTKLIEGVDLIIDGHSHELYEEGKTFEDKNGKKIPVGQTGAYTRNIGVMNFDYNKKTGEISNYKNKYINYDKWSKLNLETIEEMELLIDKADKAYELFAGEDAFALATPLTNGVTVNGAPVRTVRSFEASVGNFFADTLLWAALTRYPTDTTGGNNTPLTIANTIGFTNGGGVRASVRGDVKNGNMTKKKDWIDVSPFNNSISVIRTNGAGIWKMFEHSAKSWNDGPFAQVSKNVEVEYEVYKDKKDKDGNATNAYNTVKSIKINGVIVKNDTSQTFYVAGNDFIRNGGDGYKDTWTKPVEVYSGGTISDVLISYGTELNAKKQGATFTWADYNKAELKPSDGKRIKVTGKDKGARDFIAGF